MRKLFCITTLCFCLVMGGCSREKNDIGEVKEDPVSEKALQNNEQIVSEDNMGSMAEESAQKAEYDIYDDPFVVEAYLVPIMSKEELEDVKWDQDMLPYVQCDILELTAKNYDLKGDVTYDSAIYISFADLNMDGQREMMATVMTYREESHTFIYTVINDEVRYCGETIASIPHTHDGEKMSEYWPVDLFDVYMNDAGDFRYFSSYEDLHGGYGSYSIYETSLIDKKAYYIPAFAMIYLNDMYGYWTKDTWGDWTEFTEDDKSYTALSQIITEELKGYQKMEIPFIYTEYVIRRGMWDLTEEDKDVVRDNILAGIAHALEDAE